MSDIKEYFIITFESNYLALKAEKEFKNNKIKISFIPVPREISSACGVCIKLDKNEKYLSYLDESAYENLWEVIEKPKENSKRKEYIYNQVTS